MDASVWPGAAAGSINSATIATTAYRSDRGIGVLSMWAHVGSDRRTTLSASVGSVRVSRSKVRFEHLGQRERQDTVQVLVADEHRLVLRIDGDAARVANDALRSAEPPARRDVAVIEDAPDADERLIRGQQRQP